ncbi:hypothetical protein GUJ93_ZPchr0010g8800 [Zizania palustris]|uniref:Uncharacterized protein n=1 Tax=Zizania palustris TaxID=103762 RepID=A0A8J6BI85_ZIZPA|nr:hypothetical protein GUJ93_ZPchr0010g8800 [Zizania palustris]
MSANLIIPHQQGETIDVDNGVADGAKDIYNDTPIYVDIPSVPSTQNEYEVHEISPSVGNAKKRARVLDKGKKAKSIIALIIQEQVMKLTESTTYYTSRKHNEVSVKEIMDLVLDCGADYASDKYDIAIQLFEKKEQKEMFRVLPTKEIMFNWFRKRYNDKYKK